MVIAGLPQNILPDAYRQRAEEARERGDLSLGVLTTDVVRDRAAGRDTLPTGPFNVGAPRGETLFTRLRACRQQIDSTGDVVSQVKATLAGRGTRYQLNGLGFDFRRIAASVPGEASKRVDPVVECLCFFGLLLHPVGGNRQTLRQRGWLPQTTRPHALRWPAWRPALNRWGIDALLDAVYADPSREDLGRQRRGRIKAGWRRLGVTALYGTLPFNPTGANDPTRGYASERIA